MTEHLQEDKNWINIAKICSVGGVVIQHVRGYVYSNDYLFYSVWWVVALFVMIGGYNALASYERRGTFLLKKKLLGIYAPYSFATALYVVFNYHYLDAAVFLRHLLHFNATGPLYYVAVYIQLIIISPILIGIIEAGSTRKWLFAAAWVAVFAVGGFTTLFTNIFDIIIGGGNLFAGLWIIFWFLGMFIKYCERNISFKQEWEKWIAIFLTLAIAIWQYVFVNMGINLRLASMYHGRQVRMTWANALETVLIFFWFKYVLDLFERIAGRWGQCVLKPLSFLGKYTLYIFMYHMLFLSIYKSYLEINRWFCLAFIILGPVILGLLLKKCKEWISIMMKEVEVE